MKKVLFVFGLLISFSCNKQSENIVITESNLVGFWENRDNSAASSMLDFTYCSAFELRKNKEVAVYYWDIARPEKDRVDGTWSLENGNELILDLNFSDDWRSTIQIINFDGSEMELQEESGLNYVLTKD